MEKEWGPGLCSILVFSYCILNLPLPKVWSALSSLASELEQFEVGGGLCAGEPLVVLSATQKAWRSQRPCVGGRATGPVYSCSCFILLFCPQWSQAAPMAEGEQKAHQGESPGSWMASLDLPWVGWGGTIRSLLCWGKEQGCRNLGIRKEQY